MEIIFWVRLIINIEYLKMSLPVNGLLEELCDSENVEKQLESLKEIHII